MAKNLPDYAADPLRRFLDYLTESTQLLHLSMHGVSVLKVLPKAVEFLSNSDSSSNRVPKTVPLEVARKEAELAQRECLNGFPLLHAHTLVGLWGAFEVAIEDMLVGILVNEPQSLENDAFTKVKVPLAEFERLEKEERMRLLLVEVERGTTGRQGLDVFEALLERFDLAGPFNADLRRTVLEMHHVRNVVVHRGSIADRRLVKCCPWLGLKVGDQVRVTHDLLRQHSHALAEYVITLTKRLGVRYDVDIEARVSGTQCDGCAAQSSIKSSAGEVSVNPNGSNVRA